MSASLSRSAAGLGMASERTRLRMVTRLREQGIRDEVVLAAMAQVPRHLFVEEAFASRAYEDTALPIGFGQTISQPYVVARSCELARSGRALDMVLEIGGGCGYQAAVLGRLAREVYTIERIGALAAKARQTLSAAGVNNVKVRNADGREASSNVVQFDAIVVAAGGHVTHKVIDTAERYTVTSLSQAAGYINSEFAGMTLNEAREAIIERMREERLLYDELMRRAFI